MVTRPLLVRPQLTLSLLQELLLLLPLLTETFLSQRLSDDETIIQAADHSHYDDDN